ncbi:MAG: hypothetical protein GY913_34585 [Proteobacteria bacterium]|nr:hypothetical protein [Pseudomonadota bacterium]MCP4922058.1 hypothetical protein [Pseudomonadota bacterium]
MRRPGTWYLDFDGDGFGGADFPLDACDAAQGYVDNAYDCDDADSLTFPGGEELCNGLDDDCDGSIDNGASDALVFYGDGDGDGSLEDTVDACEAPEGYVDVSTDCDDGDGTLSPGTPEVVTGSTTTATARSTSTAGSRPTSVRSRTRQSPRPTATTSVSRPASTTKRTSSWRRASRSKARVTSSCPAAAAGCSPTTTTSTTWASST